MGDDPLLVDHEGDSRGISLIDRIAGAVGDGDPAAGVAEQWEGVAELFGKGLVVFDAVEARAQDLNVLFVESFLLVTEPVPFDRSTRGIGFWIEPEDDFLSSIVRQLDGGSVMRGDFEVRSIAPYFQHTRPLPRDGADDAAHH